MIKLCDITIGQFPITQKFGENPDLYKKFGLLGHNGFDLATPDGTQLINPFPSGDEVVISFIGYDPSDQKGYDKGGYGNFIRIWSHTQQFVVIYAHCKVFNVVTGDKLFFQQLIGLSNNSGNSAGPHTHVGGYFVDVNGTKLNRDNGFDGFVNLLNPKIVRQPWQISNPTAPATSPLAAPTVTIPVETHTQLVTNSDNFQRVIDILKPGNQVDITTSKEIIDVVSDYQDRLKTLDKVEAERNQALLDVERLTKQVTDLTLENATKVSDSPPLGEGTQTPLPVEATPSPTGETYTDTISLVERFFKYLFSLK